MHAPADSTARSRLLRPLHVHLSVLFTALILVSGSLMIWHNSRETSRILLSASDDVFARIGRETTLELQRLFAPLRLMTDVYAHQQFSTDRTLDARLQRLPALVQGLARNPAAAAFYAGYANGDFFLLRRLPADEAQRRAFAAPPGAAWLVQSIEHAGGGAQGRFVYFDAALREIARVERPDYRFDPRTRDWYRRALAADDQVTIEPYVFFTTREPGVSFARRGRDGTSVIGADVTLAELSASLARQRVTPSAEIAAFDAAGRVIAHSDPKRTLWRADGADHVALTPLGELQSPVLTALATRLAGGIPEGNLALAVDGRDWIGRVVTLGSHGAEVYLGIVAPRDELLGDAARIRQESILITVLILLLTVPAAWFISRAISKSLRRLQAEAQDIRRFRFDAPQPIRSFVLEIDELARTMELMRDTIRRFLDISTALAAERDLDRLLGRVLGESLALTGAGRGVVYLRDETGALRPAQHAGAREDGDEHALDPAKDAAHPAVAAVRENRASVSRNGNAGVAALPLRNRHGEVVGALLIGRSAGDGTGALSAELLAFVEALSGTAAVSIETRQLFEAQKDLLEALIRLMANAIDAKSPYTGGHCQRVPEIAKLLARAACDAQDGPYRDFRLDDEAWEAVHIASWLHDCGKVVTPEYVVDKATKLETLCDRIHEIRMRFEVIKRDAEIACWKAVAAGGDRTALQAELAEAWAALDADYAFVAKCNVGGEFMAPERVARLRAIAQRTWLRTLDDRLGVSREEGERKARTPAAPLPVVEPLLADKDEHLVEREAQATLGADNPWGFRVKQPRWKFNRGELYNLSIGRGTLTEEERFIINDHMAQTIMMLECLPFPRHLKSVPEMAGGHHEKMDGTGYPRGLTGAQMSPVARMLAIADIFEALTAADRPYKKGKRLSEAIAIMHRMKEDRHIDPELFELFLRAGVHREYAQRHLRPEQIDEFDLAPYLSAA